MIQQKKINVERILRVNRVGAWRIEIEDGKSPSHRDFMQMR